MRTSIVPPGPCPPLADTPGTSPAVTTPQVTASIHDFAGSLLYASLFASTCPIALIDDRLAGAVIAFRSQEHPDDIYIQDVMTHPACRRRGVTRALLAAVHGKALEWGCRRLYLTSEPDNAPAHAAWTALGFRNMLGDYTVGEVSVTADYKGPGKDRAVYEFLLNQAL